MLLKSNKDFWNFIASSDPFWAILSTPSKRHNKWDPEEFFKSGEVEVDKIVSELKGLVILNKNETAVDFGCGVGRCTRRLSKYFGNIYGVDISGVMINKAIEYNKNIPNCTFEEIEGTSLAKLKDNSIDFILSIITLQHLSEKIQLAYIRELIRILSTKGILYFQTVTDYSCSFYGILKRLTKNKIAHYYNKYRYKLKSPIEMYICRESEIVKLINEFNLKIISKCNDNRAGQSFVSKRYILQKR